MIHEKFILFHLILLIILISLLHARVSGKSKRSNLYCDDENLIIKNKHLFTTFIVFFTLLTLLEHEKWEKFLMEICLLVVGVFHSFSPLDDSSRASFHRPWRKMRREFFQHFQCRRLGGGKLQKAIIDFPTRRN